MPDVVAPAVRSRMMAGIRGKDTKPELVLRRGLHRMGFRFRLHPKELPGRPDMVFPGRRAVILAHGCFWHGHDCPLFRWPGTRQDFWRTKIEGNRARDSMVVQTLGNAGWRVLTVWECALRGAGRLELPAVLEACAAWLRSTEPCGEIRGKSDAS